MASRSDRLAAVVAALVLTLASSSRAAPTEVPENVQRARNEYAAAVEHVKQARWGEALAAFERSAAARPHVLTTYNIGACERALGRYVRARASLAAALAMDEAAPKRELPASFAADAKKWVQEIDALLVKASVALTPADAQVLVDGAPLVADGSSKVLLAGLSSVEGATRAPGGRFEAELDPGTHIFSISRPGFTNAIVTKTFTPGSKVDVELDLKSLPATIQISASHPGAVVTIDDVDVGVTPVTLSRPAGDYRIVVRKAGFVPYVTKVKVAAGDHPALAATLTEETTPVFEKGWFWGAAVVVVAGAATATYFIARPAPERPAPDGGGLGWAVPIPAK